MRVSRYAASCSISSSVAIARASSRSRLTAVSPEIRMRRSRRSSIRARLSVRGTLPLRARDGRIFSRKALACELRYRPSRKGMSDEIGPGPRRGRSTMPGNSVVLPRSLTRQTDPSGAGTVSKAVRSATRAPGKVPGDDRPEIAPNDLFGRVVEVLRVEARRQLPESSGLHGPGYFPADRRMGHESFGQLVQHPVHGTIRRLGARRPRKRKLL